MRFNKEKPLFFSQSLQLAIFAFVWTMTAIYCNSANAQRREKSVIKQSSLEFCAPQKSVDVAEWSRTFHTFVCSREFMLREHFSPSSRRTINARDARPTILAFETDYERAGVSITVRHAKRVTSNFNPRQIEIGTYAGTINDLSHVPELACLSGLSRTKFRELTGWKQYVRDIKFPRNSLRSQWDRSELDAMPYYEGAAETTDVYARFVNDGLIGFYFNCGS